MSTGSRQALYLKTECQSSKRLGQVSVDLSGPSEVAALGKKCYIALFRDDFTLFILVYFLVHKYDVAGYCHVSLPMHVWTESP